MLMTLAMIAVYVLGFLVAFVALAALAVYIITDGVKTYKNRAWDERRETVAISLSEIRNYCSYEYPQIEMVVDEVRKSLRNGNIVNADNFRQRLRKTFPQTEAEIRLINDKYREYRRGENIDKAA